MLKYRNHLKKKLWIRIDTELYFRKYLFNFWNLNSIYKFKKKDIPHHDQLNGITIQVKIISFLFLLFFIFDLAVSAKKMSKCWDLLTVSHDYDEKGSYFFYSSFAII